MALRINRHLSVWDGEWRDTRAYLLEDAAAQFAGRRGWEPGTWSVSNVRPAFDHFPVAHRRFHVEYGAEEEPVVEEVAATEPVGFVVPPADAARSRAHAKGASRRRGAG